MGLRARALSGVCSSAHQACAPPLLCFFFWLNFVFCRKQELHTAECLRRRDCLEEANAETCHSPPLEKRQASDKGHTFPSLTKHKCLGGFFFVNGISVTVLLVTAYLAANSHGTARPHPGGRYGCHWAH